MLSNLLNWIMSSLRDSTVQASDSRNNFNEEQSDFRRRVFINNKWRLPRRYIIAILLSLVLMLQVWRVQNVIYILVDIIYTEEFHIPYPALGNWTIEDINQYGNSLWIGETCAQFPAALLIYVSSSSKFLTVSVAFSSILHMLTPVALTHNSWTLYIVLFGQGIALAPVRVAALSMWKDWAPPAERTKLLILAFSGSYIFASFPTLHFFLVRVTSMENNFYLSGICGLVWSLFWSVAVSENPSNDPLISENEFIYLRNTIPATGVETSNLLKVPWKNILSSASVWTISLVYFKVACSLNVIMISTVSYSLDPTIDLYGPFKILITFLILYILMLPVIAVLGDYVSNRFRGHILTVRRGFLCGAFILHAVIMLGIIFHNSLVKISFFVLSYIVFLFSIPGYITVALDLSSRYVTIICGIIETFFCFGSMCIHYALDYLFMYHIISSFEYLFLIDGILAIIVAGIFYKWGSVDEQPWSSTFSTSRGTTDYQRYPSPEDEDDIKLVTESV